MKTNTRFDINGIKNAFKKTEREVRDGSGSFNDYYPFWNMKDEEEAIIRFLPDKNTDNPFGFLIEKMTHKLTINGEERKVTCMKTYGKECPICKVSSSFYNSGDEDKGKQYWRSKQHLAQVLVIKDPLPPDKDTGETHAGKYRLVSLSWQLFEVIKAAFEVGDFDTVPFAFEGGCDFIIKKTKQGKYSTYAVSSRFARKSRDLTDEEIEIAEEHMVDLSTLLPPMPSYEKIEAMLQASLTGEDWNENDSDDDDSKATKSQKLPSKSSAKSSDDDDDDDDRKVKSKKPVTKPAVEEDDDEEEDEILAAIRQRRKAKAE
jgi:hypothetical protein